jgi:hypothetical protein
MVDALDECPKSELEREKLLGVIRHILGWKMEQIHILATSRKEIDITGTLSNIPTDICYFQDICIQEIHVEQDIKKFVGHRLQGPRFANWKPELKLYVENQLASSADGMYVSLINVMNRLLIVKVSPCGIANGCP